MTTQAQTNLSDYLTKRMPKRETRAVWLTTLASLDWPKNYARSEESIKLQKQELIDILDKYQKANINTVLLQARVRAATIYPSDIEPWDQCITGVEKFLIRKPFFISVLQPNEFFAPTGIVAIHA